MTTYPVNTIYSTIQGEGCQTGMAMVLVRLQGCAVGCPWCDTKETWAIDDHFRVDTIDGAIQKSMSWYSATASELVAYVAVNLPGPRWILVTGGEPANYPLGELVGAFQDAGYKVALETSGTETGHLDANFDWICVSPKIKMPGKKLVRPEACAVADEIKHVVGRQADVDALDSLLSTIVFCKPAQVCLQPVSQSQVATALCIQTVKERGWRLSLQTHKYIQLP